MSNTYWWRFREQDGSWTEWFVCSYNEFLRHIGEPDVDVKMTEG